MTANKEPDIGLDRLRHPGYKYEMESLEIEDSLQDAIDQLKKDASSAELINLLEQIQSVGLEDNWPVLLAVSKLIKNEIKNGKHDDACTKARQIIENSKTQKQFESEGDIDSILATAKAEGLHHMHERMLRIHLAKGEVAEAKQFLDKVLKQRIEAENQARQKRIDQQAASGLSVAELKESEAGLSLADKKDNQGSDQSKIDKD